MAVVNNAAFAVTGRPCQLNWCQNRYPFFDNGAKADTGPPVVSVMHILQQCKKLL